MEAPNTLKCPECGSSSYVSNGQRKRKNGSTTQLFKCRECNFRFSENYKRSQGLRYLSIHYAQEGEKMDTTTEQQKSVAGDLKNINGKIVEYLFKLEKQGLAPATRRLASSCLRNLQFRGADLADPESIKIVLANQSNKETAYNNKTWSGSRKRNMINTYTQFLKFLGHTWEPPKNNVVRKIPFIPIEQEIDDLIAGTPSTVATMLQLLKETGMRSGEAIRLKWIDVQLQQKVILLNDPEKGSNPRTFNSLSGKLLTMLNQLPRENEYLFGNNTLNSLKATFTRSRKRLAFKLGNPRLTEIHFHTLRHYAATMLYHYTKDIMEVKQFLGHREIENTQLYIQLDKQLFQTIHDEKFTTRIAHCTDECCKLIDVGFEYVTGTFEDGGKIFRKRK